MKKTDLEKSKAKKIEGGVSNARGNMSAALDKREQAVARKRELLERQRRPK
ncbi:MAG TPA: hypothetical protein VGI57_05165 [Usitatibacter sp.]|jgi:hypothetical protein